MMRVPRRLKVSKRRSVDGKRRREAQGKLQATDQGDHYPGGGSGHRGGTPGGSDGAVEPSEGGTTGPGGPDDGDSLLQPVQDPLSQPLLPTRLLPTEPAHSGCLGLDPGTSDQLRLWRDGGLRVCAPDALRAVVVRCGRACAGTSWTVPLPSGQRPGCWRGVAGSLCPSGR